MAVDETSTGGAGHSAGSGTGLMTGRVAIVTGAAQGLGAAYAARLADEGAAVVAVDVQPCAAPPGGSAVQADVGEIDDVRRVVDGVVASHGGVDILVNNAGWWRPTPVDADRDQALADYTELFEPNVRGPFLMGRAVVPLMLERGGGDIVNISTYYVLPPRPADFPGTNPPTTDLYAASKWALNGFTQAWALALRDRHIRVNALAMGGTDTPMLRGLYTSRGEEPPSEAVASWMTPAEQAQLLIDLLAEGPDGRTGETIGSWIGQPIALPPRRGRGEPIV